MVQHFRCKQATCKRHELHAPGKQPGRRMHVRTSFDMYSDRHVFGLLLCAGVIVLCCAVLCCAVLCSRYGSTKRYAHTERRKNGGKTKKERQESTQGKEIQERSPILVNNIVVGSYRLRGGRLYRACPTEKARSKSITAEYYAPMCFCFYIYMLFSGARGSVLAPRLRGT